MLEAELSQLSHKLAIESPSNGTSNDIPLYQLALQVQHNLEFQHRWTNIKIHTTSPKTKTPLARPIISGLPPRRIYVHPDEQIEFVKKEAEQARSKEQRGLNGSDDIPEDTLELKPELEWVFPAHLREEWTLRKFAIIFDSIDALPPGQSSGDSTQEARDAALKWRTTKRALVAILQDDSTFVYYIVHDGIVKPRQN